MDFSKADFIKQELVWKAISLPLHRCQNKVQSHAKSQNSRVGMQVLKNVKNIILAVDSYTLIQIQEPIK